MTSRLPMFPNPYIPGRKKSFEMSFLSWFALPLSLPPTHTRTNTYTLTLSLSVSLFLTHSHLRTHTLIGTSYSRMHTHAFVVLDAECSADKARAFFCFVSFRARAHREPTKKKGLSKKVPSAAEGTAMEKGFQFLAFSGTIFQCQQISSFNFGGLIQPLLSGAVSQAFGQLHPLGQSVVDWNK